MNYSSLQPFGESASSSAPASSSTSPNLQSVPMVTAPGRVSPALSSSSSNHGTPSHGTVDLPHRASSSAGKGGCWTCRLRRKKCDEEREGGSCRTCRRLTIECLGWGARRPEWMRDKSAVERYKAEIKAKLTRAGLIRGQPRTSLSATRGSMTRAGSYTRMSHSASEPSGPTNDTLGLDLGFNNYPYDQSNMNGMAGASSFHHPSYSESNLASIDFGAPLFQYSPQSSSVHSEPNMLDFDLGLFPSTHNPDTAFDFAVRPPSPVHLFPLLAGQNSIQESHVMYFFEHVRKTNFRLANTTLTNVTYSSIIQDPRGAVTNAVSAISSLHFTRRRVSQGLEVPDPNPEHSTAQYFHDEAYFQLVNGKQSKGCHDENDVLAAIYLIFYTQMAGNGTDWQPLLTHALDWIGQTGLTTDENPRLTLLNMSPSRQLVVKLTMWIEIFASFTATRPARYTALYKCLLGDATSYWGAMPGNSHMDVELLRLNMESLTGCPDDVMLSLLEVSHLAHWKAAEQRKGALSLRELLRRSDEIEQRLRNRKSTQMHQHIEAPLHPNLLSATMSDPNPVSTPNEEVMQLMGNIFRETGLLYLHTTVNDMHPAVPEISAGVTNMIQLLRQLSLSDIDRALTFPICLAGCMTDDSVQRDILKARLQAQDESIGNLMRTRLVMEAVWQRRDTRGGVIDWRIMQRERCAHLLLI